MSAWNGSAAPPILAATSMPAPSITAAIVSAAPASAPGACVALWSGCQGLSFEDPAAVPVEMVLGRCDRAGAGLHGAAMEVVEGPADDGA